MQTWKLRAPVAFLIFNRPDTTARVFAEIARAKPLKLLVVADGPRPERPGEAERCAATRAIIEQVDWDCEVLTNYSEINLGCKKRISSGLDWVFDTVEEAIILEDDCLPHPTFFRFCEELLEKYRHDERIAQVDGSNFQFGQNRTNYNYYFSNYPQIWGWATWRRAWRLRDIEMRSWPLIRDTSLIANMLQKPDQIKYWKKIFQRTYQGEIDSWDYPWVLSCWLQNTLAISPNVNLIRNIGFGSMATNTKIGGRCGGMAVEAMSFPLRHPPYIVRNYSADLYLERTKFSYTLLRRTKSEIKDFVELKFPKLFKLYLIIKKAVRFLLKMPN